MIKLTDVRKTYGDGKEALKGINLEIKEGEFVGLLGPNGAGKTTTINIMSGNVRKTDGTVEIGGFDLDTHALETKKVLGVVPQEVSFDSFFTVNEVLLNQSGYFGIKNNQAYIDTILEALSLSDKKYANTKALSGGMKRRLLIAKALVHKPKFFVLDEPTAGVDIELRQSLYKYVRKLHEEGTTMLLTTHYLEEAELLCDRIVIINNGEIIADDSTDKLIASIGNTTEIEFQFNEKINEKDFELFKKFDPKCNNHHVTLSVQRDEYAEVFKLLSESKIDYNDFKMKEANLEDVFLKLTSNK